jgi:superfamily I DNA/RNA helicase
MARNRVIHATSAFEGLTLAAEWIGECPGPSEVLVIGATKAAIDEFARGLAPLGSLGLHCFSFPQLATELALLRMAEVGLAPLSRLGEEAVAARITYRLNQASELVYFGPVANMAGFAPALASTISELRLAGIRPGDLNHQTGAVQDIRELLAAYENELEEQSLADFAKILQLATATAESGSHRLFGFPIILLDVPLRSTAHTVFLRALARRSAWVSALTQSHDFVSIAGLESALGVRAESMWNEPTDNAVAQVRNYLFSPELPPKHAFDSSVDLFSAPGEGLEAVEIARRIRWHADEGVPFDRVAVLLRNPERYQPLIEEALRRAGIPAYFSRGAARPDPAGRAFLALLACAGERCSASRFAEYLSLGQTPRLDASGAPEPGQPGFVPPLDEVFPAVPTESQSDDSPEGATVATPIAWERLLVDAAVVGGRDRWFRRLRGLEQEFRLQLSALKEGDASERERIERQLERLQNLERFALPLIEMLDALPRTAHWRQWLDHLRVLAARALRQPESVLALLNELEPMADVGPVGIDEVSGVLTEHLRFLRREPPHRRYRRVFVGTIEEARGRSFDIVFLPGLAEGLFPRRNFEDPLLLDDARRLLSQNLTCREDRVAEERMLLHTAVAAARNRLVVSYPSLDLAQGRPRVPSFYALEIARTIEGTVPELRGFERRTTANAEARLIWPAPGDTSHAIDDAEYDLAWHSAHGGERGSGAYLISANAALGRSLRTRYRRWEKPWSAADGCLKADSATKAILQSRQLDHHAFSASALQQFATCPYRFYLYGIYGLRQREDSVPLEQMDPLTRGALFHAVQFEFFRAWQRFRNAPLNQLLDVMDRTLDFVAAEYGEKLAPAIPRVWASEIEDLRTDLKGWLRLWIESAGEWEPIHFELGFGLPANEDRHDPSSSPDPVALDSGVLVRGSIDLVEKHRTRGVLRVTDHKTGKAPEQEPVYVGGGGILQPGLYGLAVEKLLYSPTESGRLYYCTQRGGFTPIDINLTPPARKWFDHAIGIVASAVEDACLPAAPQEGACDYCDYHLVCGPYEEIRIKHWKDKTALDSLQQLRNIP